MYNIYYIFIHAENVGAFVLARKAFRAIHTIRTAIQRRRVWVGVTETAMCMYTSSRKSDVLFRWCCCRCRFSDHPAVHKSRGIEADNSRVIPLWGYKVCDRDNPTSAKTCIPKSSLDFVPSGSWWIWPLRRDYHISVSCRVRVWSYI